MLPKPGSMEEKLFELYRLLGPRWIKLAMGFQMFVGFIGLLVFPFVGFVFGVV